MMSYGRWGMYGGKKCFFNLRNPKNGDVWSDDIPVQEYDSVKHRAVTRYGAWVASDKVQWL